MRETNDASADRPWITVLSPTLTSNAVFRTHEIIRLLQNRFRVQLIGFDASDRIFAPLATTEWLKGDLRFHSNNLVGWFRKARGLARHVKGDALICIKPRLGSFGTGLWLGRRLGRPVILDIDDWEPGFLASSPYWEFRSHGVKWLFDTDSPLFTRALDGFTYRAAAVTVSNSFLQGLYGGHWLPHLRDGSFLRPMQPRGSGDKRTVLFSGSVRAHKGLEALCRVWRRLARTDAVLHLAVSDPDEPWLRRLPFGDLSGVNITGPHDFGEIPQLLADASVVVVPQDNARGSVGQLPMKLIDAMAAAKPIVATDVCDAARWLHGGAGIVVTPGSDEALAEGLSQALDHPEQWAEMGRRARARFLEFASESVLEDRLCSVVSSVIQKQEHPPLAAFAATNAERRPSA
jgi:glycosyltransferase involved in cell wall biosynthesis